MACTIQLFCRHDWIGRLRSESMSNHIYYLSDWFEVTVSPVKFLQDSQFVSCLPDQIPSSSEIFYSGQSTQRRSGKFTLEFLKLDVGYYLWITRILSRNMRPNTTGRVSTILTAKSNRIFYTAISVKVPQYDRISGLRLWRPPTFSIVISVKVY